MIIFSIFLIIIVILTIGVPVGIGLGISGILLSMYLEGTKTLISIPQTIFSSGNSFLLSAIPLFILMSEILKKANIIQILFDTVNKFVGNLRGGLAITTIITSAIGASITGSSVANAASMCIVAADPMIKMGYKRNFTYGLIAVSGTLGILIPPSIPMLLFASVTNESVGKLFLAGIIPGLVLTFILCLYVIIFPNLKSKSKKLIINHTFAEKILSIKKAIPALFLPILIIGGIYMGLFTPTESAAVGVAYALFTGFFFYKTLKIGDLFGIFRESLHSTCMITLLIAGSMILGHAVTSLKIGDDLIILIQQLNLSNLEFVLAIMLLLFVIGCILEVISIIYIIVPILYPILVSINIDPIWFAILFVVNMEIALITPPIGMVLYVIAGIVKRPISEVISGTIPFILVLVFFIFVLILFPQIVSILKF